MSNTMMTVVIVVAVVLLLVWFITYRRKWLEKQSPAGTWICEHPEYKITLQFNVENGPLAGTFYRLFEHNGESKKVFGSWYANLSRLKMLILASELPERYRIGQEFDFHIFYAEKDLIWITEGRDKIRYQRAPEGVKLEFESKKKDA